MADYHDPTPAPAITADQLHTGQHPEGWDFLVLGELDSEPVVLAGRTADGVFHQYASTEQIVAAVVAPMTGSCEHPPMAPVQKAQIAADLAAAHLDPALSADNGTVGTTSHTREVSLIAEALCDCSQTKGRHARTCVTIRAQNFRRLTNALAAHDERTARDTEAFCRSCGEQLDPDNMLRLNGIPYHLGNCPRPHPETSTP